MLFWSHFDYFIALKIISIIKRKNAFEWKKNRIINFNFCLIYRRIHFSIDQT